MGETSPNNAGDEGSVPGRGAKIPHASWPKNQNRNSIVTNSIKTFKMVKKKKKNLLPSRRACQPLCPRPLAPPFLSCVA